MFRKVRPERKPSATTVSALLDEARWLLDEERVQGERLDTKLFQLAGVAGVILAIVAPMGANGLGITLLLAF
jgi:hypothetical protein